MSDLVTVVLALVLGAVVGFGVGVARATALYRQARVVRRAGAGLARIFPETAPVRSAADVLAGRVRISLGGVIYELPVLPRAASRAWLESLDSRFATLAMALDEAGNDAAQVLPLLLAEQDGMYALLLSYDQAGILPPADQIDELASDAEILRAVLEVWAAANPLAGIAAGAGGDGTATSSHAPRSSPPQPTAGVPTTSTPS